MTPWRSLVAIELWFCLEMSFFLQNTLQPNFEQRRICSAANMIQKEMHANIHHWCALHHQSTLILVSMRANLVSRARKNTIFIFFIFHNGVLPKMRKREAPSLNFLFLSLSPVGVVLQLNVVVVRVKRVSRQFERRGQTPVNGC